MVKWEREIQKQWKSYAVEILWFNLNYFGLIFKEGVYDITWTASVVLTDSEFCKHLDDTICIMMEMFTTNVIKVLCS